jgi:hypothetical protein
MNSNESISQEHLRQTLEHYRQQRQRRLEEFRAADNLVRQLEADLQEPLSAPELDSLRGPNIPVETHKGAPNRMPDVRADEFYSMTQSEAAKAFLRKVKGAIPFDQLVEALRKGGAQLGGADPIKTLYVSLARNPLREFVYPNEGIIGLREFYPNLNRGTGSKKPKKAKRQAKRKIRPKKVKLNASPKARSEGAAKARNQVKQIMKDGQPHTGQEIVTAVEAAVGPIKKIWVYGALRGYKKQEDGRYTSK